MFDTPEDKWLADCIQLRGKTNEVGLMVWGCFWGAHRVPLVPILESKVDRWAYIGLLDRHCTDPTISSYNHYHLSPNGIPSGNQRGYGLVYFDTNSWST